MVDGFAGSLHDGYERKLAIGSEQSFPQSSAYAKPTQQMISGVEQLRHEQDGVLERWNELRDGSLASVNKQLEAAGLGPRVVE